MSVAAAVRKARFINLGLTEYRQAWDLQNRLMDEILTIKAANRSAPPDAQQPTPNFLIFCEHPHVYTLGRNGSLNNLLINEAGLKHIQASFVHTSRGGDITYHGPGQLVGYPIFDLENFFTDIHRYMRSLEEAVIRTLKTFGITAGRLAGLTGVWIDPHHPQLARKICAMGVKTSRWVTQHGFALNVNTDLSYFDYIVPCGISDKAVTSMQKELGKAVSMDYVAKEMKEQMAEVFELTWI
ncbi:MAG: lipoyl(octanoyl) transferase LipB [Cyclobacteriaceae bacterium]|nr:lipoyl(octanoyl) transferase LipB [Cyclobacteriaceae bacterium]MDW8330717.1 lipoyl(octanoyl) transferase LipB [Cyclobacteriaceae bacterium]